jgi:hypothetical protein
MKLSGKMIQKALSIPSLEGGFNCNPEALAIIEKAVKLGYVRRISQTQAEWIEEGFNRLEAEENRPINYGDYVIVKSNKIKGWYMTECESVCGESVEEVIGDIDRKVVEENLDGKVTVYFKNSFGMGINKIEGKLKGVGTEEYAQYRNAAYLKIIPKRKRNVRKYMQTYDPYMLVLAGHGHPDISDGMMTISESAGIVVKQSKYTSFDENWTKDSDEVLNNYLADNRVVVIADYRASEGFSTGMGGQVNMLRHAGE